jgi:hypothetical protein
VALPGLLLDLFPVPSVMAGYFFVDQRLARDFHSVEVVAVGGYGSGEDAETLHVDSNSSLDRNPKNTVSKRRRRFSKDSVDVTKAKVQLKAKCERYNMHGRKGRHDQNVDCHRTCPGGHGWFA